MDDQKRAPASNSAGNSADGWACAWDEHQRWLRTVLFARLRDHEEVDEALQQVALAAAQGVKNLRDRAKMAPWLYRIALTTVLQRRRNSSRHKKRLRAYAEKSIEVDDTRENDPLGWLLAKESQQLVKQALAALPGRDSEVLLLKYTEDWSYRELAEHLGLSISAVEARLHRARHKFRQALAKLDAALV